MRLSVLQCNAAHVIVGMPRQTAFKRSALRRVFLD